MSSPLPSSKKSPLPAACIPSIPELKRDFDDETDTDLVTKIAETLFRFRLALRKKERGELYLPSHFLLGCCCCWEEGSKVKLSRARDDERHRGRGHEHG